MTAPATLNADCALVEQAPVGTGILLKKFSCGTAVSIAGGDGTPGWQYPKIEITLKRLGSAGFVVTYEGSSNGRYAVSSWPLKMKMFVGGIAVGELVAGNLIMGCRIPVNETLQGPLPADLSTEDFFKALTAIKITSAGDQESC